MSAYRYTAADPRTQPTWYMYSEMEGPQFLSAYAAARRNAVERLARVAQSGGDALVAVLGGAGTGVPAAAAPPLRGPVQTEALLRVLVTATDAGSSGKHLRHWTTELARKYEVAGRLRAAYGPDLRPAGPEEPPLAAYGMFASLLGRWAEASGDLRALNALLKLNDLLLAMEPELDAIAAAGAAAGIAAELRAIGALALARGLALEDPA